MSTSRRSFLKASAAAGDSRRSIEKALEAGLAFRPLAVTGLDTIAYHKKRPEAEQQRLIAGRPLGLSAQREADVLAAWKAKQGKG